MLTLFSPAKINLFLRIVNKRPDGYHNLSSLFQAIDLGDVITFKIHHEDSLTCTDPSLPVDQTNLIIKALHLFRHKTGLQNCFKIHLEKNIPTEAGLGGGSSNAATTLWALNQLSGNIATVDQLSSWSAEIGSDIPFFLSTGTAYCTGRGEHVQNLPPLSSRSLLIAKPNFGLSTPAVYKRLILPSQTSQQDDLQAFFNGAQKYFNDLEKPAFELNPDLQDIKNELLSCGFETVLLSGSGSSFFCLGEGQTPKIPNIHLFQAKFINRSPTEWYKKSNFIQIP